MTSPAQKIAKEKAKRGRKEKPQANVRFPRLRKVRHALGLTMRDVSDGTGICHTFVHQMETGKSDPGVLYAIRMAKFYGTTVEALFSTEGE